MFLNHPLISQNSVTGVKETRPPKAGRVCNHRTVFLSTHSSVTCSKARSPCAPSILLHLCSRSHTFTHTLAHTHARTHSHTHAHTLAHTHAHTLTHTRTHTLAHTHGKHGVVGVRSILMVCTVPNHCINSTLDILSSVGQNTVILTLCALETPVFAPEVSAPGAVKPQGLGGGQPQELPGLREGHQLSSLALAGPASPANLVCRPQCRGQRTPQVGNPWGGSPQAARREMPV